MIGAECRLEGVKKSPLTEDRMYRLEKNDTRVNGTLMCGIGAIKSVWLPVNVYLFNNPSVYFSIVTFFQ